MGDVKKEGCIVAFERFYTNVKAKSIKLFPRQNDKFSKVMSFRFDAAQVPSHKNAMLETCKTRFCLTHIRILLKIIASCD